MKRLGEAEGSDIVYAAAVKEVGELAESLLAEGFEENSYHGRMKAKNRAAARGRFMSGASRVIVATNAFGLGIETSDIHFVIHRHRPATLEAYDQEAGRAGQLARCTLLYRPEDRGLSKFFRSGEQPGLDGLLYADNPLVNGTEAGPAAIDDLLPSSPEKKARLQQVLT